MSTAKLFLHGVPDSPAIWRPLLSALDLGDTPVAVPALPGFTAPLPAGFTPTKEAYADWAVAQAEALAANHGPVDIVGHDWGALIAQRAAAQLKPVLLELGGKAPLLVLDDADLDEAVKAAAFGAFFNQGQICMSTERIVLDAKVADAFLEKFTAKAAALVAGDPRDGRTPLGSVVDQGAADHVQSLIDDAVAKGAVLHRNGAPDGTLLPAAILDHVTTEMRIYAEESFGPVVTIVRVEGEEQAVAVANDTEYGLSAAVFTRDVARGLRVARRIRSGICHVNGPTVHDEAQMPFGGVKASGYGRFGGKAGIDAFTELRWITVETQPGHFPI